MIEIFVPNGTAYLKATYSYADYYMDLIFAHVFNFRCIEDHTVDILYGLPTNMSNHANFDKQISYNGGHFMAVCVKCQGELFEDSGICKVCGYDNSEDNVEGSLSDFFSLNEMDLVDDDNGGNGSSWEDIQKELMSFADILSDVSGSDKKELLDGPEEDVLDDSGTVDESGSIDQMNRSADINRMNDQIDMDRYESETGNDGTSELDINVNESNINESITNESITNETIAKESQIGETEKTKEQSDKTGTTKAESNAETVIEPINKEPINTESPIKIENSESEQSSVTPNNVQAADENLSEEQKALKEEMESLFNSVDFSLIEDDTEEMTQDRADRILADLNIHIHHREEKKEKPKEPVVVKMESEDEDVEKKAEKKEGKKKEKKAKRTAKIRPGKGKQDIEEDALMTEDGNSKDSPNSVIQEALKIYDDIKEPLQSYKEREEPTIESNVSESDNPGTKENSLEGIMEDGKGATPDKSLFGSSNSKKKGKGTPNEVVSEEDLLEKGPFAKFLHKIFGNIEDETYKAKMEKMDEDEAKNAIIRAESKVIKAEQKVQMKKEKEDAKKAKADEAKKRKDDLASKKRARKEALKKKRQEEMDKEPVTRLNKLGIVVVSVFFAIPVYLLVNFSYQYNYQTEMTTGTTEFTNGNYERAYESVVGITVKKKDQENYDRIVLVQSLNKELSYYESYTIIKKYPEALDSLLRAINKYDRDHKKAKELSIEKQYNFVFKQVKELLAEKYSLSLEEARKIANLEDRTNYTNKVNEVCNQK